MKDATLRAEGDTRSGVFGASPETLPPHPHPNTFDPMTWLLPPPITRRAVIALTALLLSLSTSCAGQDAAQNAPQADPFVQITFDSSLQSLGWGELPSTQD